MQLGVNGVIEKGRNTAHLPKAIRKIVDGEVWISRKLTSALMQAELIRAEVTSVHRAKSHMIGKSKLDSAFETSMDTIRNSVSFPYNWEFVFSFDLWREFWNKSWMLLVVLAEGCTFRAQESFLVMKLLISLADERAHGDSELMVNFLPKRVGA